MLPLLLSLLWLGVCCLAAPPVLPARQAGADQDDGLPRLVVYFQTTHDQNNNPISMLPLVKEKGIALTHLIVSALHVNEKGEVHLNDYPPGDAHFYTLWNETEVMKRAGVIVMGMVGGAAPGSFGRATLDGPDETFGHYYDQLRTVIEQHGLEGLDIDVEEPMSRAGIARLVRRLRSDFGPAFVVSLAPVASALLPDGPNLSGFSYRELERDAPGAVDFYNAQFYSGFGSMASPRDYEGAVAAGWAPARVVAGQLTSPANGHGYVSDAQLNATVRALRARHGQIGGVMGWEYFNGEPGGEAEPWRWARVMTEVLRPGRVPRINVTEADVRVLERAYLDSVGGGAAGLPPAAVSYRALASR